MEIVNISYKGLGFSYQEYNRLDDRLIVSNFINSLFGEENDYVELSIYDESNQILDISYGVSEYVPKPDSINPENGLFSSIQLDPKRDLNTRGFNRGRLNTQYGFYKNLFNSSPNTNYWIKEISRSRTELKLTSQVLSNTQIADGFTQFQRYIASKNYFGDFYLNFGLNRLLIAVNAALSVEDDQTYLLIKLYEPLPPEFGVKNTLWFVDKISDSVSFDVDIQVEAASEDVNNTLRGPNFKIKVSDRVAQTTPYYTHQSLFSSNLTSSIQQLNSYYEDKAIDINVDYSNFENFVKFSSATERLNNFVYKIGLIEDYESQILETATFSSMSSDTITAVSQSNNLLRSKIDNIIKKFDPYEYYLYYESESFAWPKSTSQKPYRLYSVSSSIVSSWLGSETTIPSANTSSLLYSSSIYDENNRDRLCNNVPQYILDDPSNEPYRTFLDMVGQHFDNLWIYQKDLSNRYNATNNPNTGVSKDVVADALRGLGFNLYTNTSVSDNLYYTLFGMNPDGSLLPPTGSEKIGTYVTSSIDTLSANEIEKEVYKRIYHNLPYLLKTKGTQRGIKALIACYGIPEDILTVNEFGANNSYTGSGVVEINNQKINIVTSSIALGEPVLSPYTTAQVYDTSVRPNSLDVEVGFSPSNTINSNFISSSGYVNFDQLLGNPENQYKDNYPELESLKDQYFSSYTQPHSLYEYIRLIKYYNNSLFKSIRDFVPARANISTGIVIKSHLLERNKYKRNEPSSSIDNNYSQSIDLAHISGSDGSQIKSSTAWSGSTITPLGLASISSTQGVEKYAGNFSGSQITVTSLDTIGDQSERSSNPSGSTVLTVNYGALYQNVTSSVRSKQFFDLDYSYNQTVPVNFGIITQSISSSQVNNYATYNNSNAPYAQLQDSNYYSIAFTNPRFAGSKTVSSTYSKYTQGDSSYGNTAAIDKIKQSFAYLVDVYSASAFMPGRSNAQIKYLINDNEDVLDLSKANFNLFDVQNVFKSGETCDVSLFQYDEKNPYSQLLANNPTLQVYEGGWRYLPILHNVGGNSTMTQSFSLQSPVTVRVPLGSSINPSFLNPSNFQFNIVDLFVEELPPNEGGRGGSDTYYEYGLQVAITSSLGSVSSDTEISFNYEATWLEGTLQGSTTVVMGTGTNTVTFVLFFPQTTAPFYNISSFTFFASNVSVTALGGGGGSSTGSFTSVLTTEVSSSQPCLYYNTASNEIVFDHIISYYYVEGSNPLFNSTSDINWLGSGLDRVVYPFSLSVGDKISFYTSSLGWNERFEYTVKSVRFTGSSSNITGSRLIALLDSQLDGSLVTSQSIVPDAVTGANFRTCRYVVWKHVPDETNVMLRYDPKDSTLVENGLLYPQYIDEDLRDRSGDIIKSLKAQNLITDQ